MAFISKITPLGSSTTYDISALQLHKVSNIGSGATDHGVALKTYFDANYSIIPRDSLIHFYDQTSGHGSGTFGYFLHDYNTNPYGGFYVAHYNTPYYVGINNGTYTQWQLVKNDGTSWNISISGNAATSSSCTGNAASASTATKLTTARTIWGQSFNGTANISGSMTDVGPDMKLPASQSRFQFLTSTGSAGNGYFGKIGLCGTYATIDSNIGSYSFYNSGTSRVDGTIYRPNSTLGSSWIGSRDLTKSCLAVDASDSTSSVAYTLESIKFSTKTFGMCAERAGNTYGIVGWSNSRTANGYDWYFYVANDGYFHCNTRVYGAVWNDYAEKRNVPEAQQNWTDEECAANPLAGRCVREIGDDTMVLSDARMQKGCKIISDTFGFSIGETENCKTPIAVSGRVLAYLLEDRDIAKKHIGDFVCSGPNGTVSIMTTEEYFKCPQAVVGTISAVPDYEIWGTGKVKVDGRIWIYVK